MTTKSGDLILFRLFDYETFYIGICQQKELKGFIDDVNPNSPLGERIASTRASERLIGYECYPGSHQAGRELYANYSKLLEEYKDGLLSDLVPEPPLTASEQRFLVKWRGRQGGGGFQTLYYVYILSDTDGIFYVGSGTQQRIYSSKHVPRCKSIPTVQYKKPTPENTAKRKRLKHDKLQGIPVQADVIYCHTDRQAVYAAEQRAIDFFGSGLVNNRHASKKGYHGNKGIPASLPYTIGKKWKPYAEMI